MGVAKYIKDEKDRILEVKLQSGISVKPSYGPKDLDEIGFHLGRIPSGVASDKDVLANAQSGENPASFRDLGYSHLDPLMGGYLVDPFLQKIDPAGYKGDKT